MTTRAKIFIAGLFFSLASHASMVKLKISLNPVGSFTAECDTLAGVAKALPGDTYTTENVTLRLDDLKTGVELRDRHMKEKYFETKKFPQAVLKSAKGTGGKFDGILTVHGVEKPVSGRYRINNLRLEADFVAKTSDFGIESAEYMGLGVEDEVRVSLALPISATPANP